MVLKRTRLSDDLPMAEWQRIRGLQLDGDLGSTESGIGTSQASLDDEMPMSEWRNQREQQVQGAGAPVRLAQLNARPTQFAPMSERQWEVEAAQSAHSAGRRSGRPAQTISAEQWALGRVGEGEYGKWSDNAPDARGALNNRLPPSLRGYTESKCNQFVWDALTAAGVQPGRLDDGRIPLAKDWGDPKSKIGGYAPVTGPPQPGDVISYGHHVGIYSPLPDGRPGTISAASPFSGDAGWNGGVVHNDWGFRREQNTRTVWRPSALGRK